ncbi:MAG: GntR family transcriptional regulator [Actinomycetes bacterium]
MTSLPRASDLAYNHLLDRILTLQLPPGEPINEQAIADEMGLSRIPIHEAVLRLAIDGFIVTMPRRGSRVTPLQLDDIRDMFEAREAIECGVAHIAARRASNADLANLRRLIEAAEQTREGTDYDKFLRDDLAIHQFLVGMVRNSQLQAAADRLLLHNQRLWRSYWSSQPVRTSTMISHSDLLLALEAGDSDGASRAMRQHIGASLDLLQSSLRSST